MLGVHRRRRTRAAGATSPPARTCSSTSSQLEQTPEVLRLLAVGRADEPRGLRRHRAQRRRLPPRRRVPVRGARHHARGPRRPPTASCATRSRSGCPRKFKINFSGCATDCGQAMFNDVGVIAVSRPLARRHVEPGFQVFIAGGLGANPHPAQALEEFTSREDLLADDRGVPARVRPLRQPRQQAARPHEVARRHDGHRRAARAHHQGAQVPRRVGHRTRRHPRRSCEERGDAPAGVGTDVDRRSATRRAGRVLGHRPVRRAGTRPTSCAAGPTAP